MSVSIEVTDQGGECLPVQPHAPNPNTEDILRTANDGTEAHDPCQKSDIVPCLKDEHWNLESITGLAAVKMLIESVQSLADATGFVEPASPAQQATTPKKSDTLGPYVTPPHNSARFTDSLPVSPISPIASLNGHSNVPSPVAMPSPEALRDEALPPIQTYGPQQTPTKDSLVRQQAAISRRFFLKTTPPFTLTEYLMRLHTYCPHSPAVYLAAAAYIHRLAVVEGLVPCTAKTIHRLTLTSIRIASKALEDNKWTQDRIAKVGGVSRKELRSLEINLCYLLDFELFVREGEMRRTMFLLQQRTKRTRAATCSEAERRTMAKEMHGLPGTPGSRINEA